MRYVGPVDGHDIDELEHDVPQRDRAVRRGPDPRARADAEGPRLPAGRGRRREAPPRRAGVRPAHRPAAGGADRLHAGVRRGDHQGGRARRRDRRHHRGDGRPDRAAAVPGPLPRPLLRRRHRRAARRHRRGRHGDGRPAPGRRDLLDVPQPGVGPGRLRRRAAPPPGRVLPRPRRHHRRRRPEPPRRVRHGAAVQGARHAGARPVERRGAAGDAARRDRARRRRARSPSAIPKGTARTSASTRSARARRPPGPRRATARCASSPIGKLVGNAAKAADALARDRRRRHGVGRPLLRPARSRR